jgi:DNA-binding XRE family transcriptional regulator
MAWESRDEMLSPNQCRAARGLLDLTQGQLAQRAQVGRKTVADFEGSHRNLHKRTVRRIEEAFVDAGIEFGSYDSVGRVAPMTTNHESGAAVAFSAGRKGGE